MKKKVIDICDWCNEVIAPGAPVVHTNSVDVASLNGRGVPVVSTKRSYHIKERDCYKNALHHQRQGAAGVAAEPACEGQSEKPGGAEGEKVSEGATTWGAAFGMSAEEALSGTRRRAKYSRSPYVQRIDRLTRPTGRR